MNEAFPIGNYQFENLIKNRVPFSLIHFEVEFSKYFQGIELSHIQRVALSAPIEPKDFGNWLGGLNLSKEQAIVVVGNDVAAIKNKACQLTQQGFINVFYLLELPTTL